MEVEFNIAGRILAKGGTRVITQAEILASVGVATAADISEESLATYCKAASAQNSCKVYVWKDREEYGNANVFNGGSDYEVVASDQFTCECECGVLIVRETVKC